MAAKDLGELTSREREVVLAAADGADTRAIAERLFLSPRTVEHHLSAAYHKLGVSNRAALVALLRDRAPDQTPVTRYALSGDTHIAYQVLGDGTRDLILIPGFVSNVETAWTWPALARFLRRLGEEEGEGGSERAGKALQGRDRGLHPAPLDVADQGGGDAGPLRQFADARQGLQPILVRHVVVKRHDIDAASKRARALLYLAR
jgi:DNA-binding CsgD family transcriptional regulator